MALEKAFLLLGVLTIISLKSNSQTVADNDGNIYQTVLIGKQRWMKENLKTKHYNNGDLITLVSDSFSWSYDTIEHYCNYNNDSQLVSIYGRLYNWFAASDKRGICPLGWHLPSKDEWTSLINFCGGSSVAGGRLKDTGTIYWKSPNTGASNESGFKALPAGYRYWMTSEFDEISLGTYFWTSSFELPDWKWGVYYLHIGHSTSSIYFDIWAANNGHSIRCLKDTTNSINNQNNNYELLIYPNPAKEKIEIIGNLQNTCLEINNLEGDILLQRKLDNNKNSIDISHLLPGIYIIKIISKQETIQKKLIKE
jgi:uncharacterized protein (TIGR02145 family)